MNDDSILDTNSLYELEDIINENSEIAEDLNLFNHNDLVVFSRDWTIETVNSQVTQNNIDLSPSFQRRNAWDDKRRSKLIESLIVGYPVPEVVLAENLDDKRSFIVIDGKQRLLSISGFTNPTIGYWKKAALVGLKVRKDLNGLTFEDLKNNPQYNEEYRLLMNADLRCTIITNYKEYDVLYDIFFRLNTGSVPLSTQEIRQAIFKGGFSDFLVESTNTLKPIHQVMGLHGPDNRLRDIEVSLRFYSIYNFGKSYKGNLKMFLDNAMNALNRKWDDYSGKLHKQENELNQSIDKLKLIFKDYKFIGRKYTEGKLESRFNRVLFEVQAYYFMYISSDEITEPKIEEFRLKFIKLCEDQIFRTSIESTTKTKESYNDRFNLFEKSINEVFQLKLNINPFKTDAHES